MIELNEDQLDAIGRMKNGCILNGGVGSGKSRTALAYYYIQNGGLINKRKMNRKPLDLYIITTARKRDTLEWEKELIPFGMSVHADLNGYSNKIKVDSWNNVGKYTGVSDAFFIFDEQRVVGKGKWVRSFLRIAKRNQWILLSATPGDKWEDYIPVFMANGFYRSRYEFESEHLVYERYLKFPKVSGYLNTGRLIKYRNDILVDLDDHRITVTHDEDIWVQYDVEKYRKVVRERWDIWEGKPIENASALCYVMGRVVNSDESRLSAVLEIFEDHPKAIVFYNYDYELALLKSLYYGPGVVVAEWNGHKHEAIPDSRSWVYLVQYRAGAEGWNCILTDTIIFYSQTYSYKTLIQAKGRIDRLNTPYIDLYYYHLKSKAGIDQAIGKALKDKKKFNEQEFVYGKKAKRRQ